MPNRINIYNYILMLIKPYISRLGSCKRQLNASGQALLEYGIILMLVVSGLVAMQLYAQRSLQARYKDATDKAINEISQASTGANASLQYEPYYQNTEIDRKNESKITRSYSSGGVSSTVISFDNYSRSGVRTELPFSDEVGE